MANILVTDELWNTIKHIFPKPKSKPRGGRPSKSNRLCLTGILFILKTGIPWEDFPQEMGCTGITLWNRLDQWRKEGILEKLHLHLLKLLRKEDKIDFSRVIVDAGHSRAVHGEKKLAQAL